MKHVFLFVLLLFSLSGISAQNLLSNPSFETYTVCPPAQSAIGNAAPWDRPPGALTTPDYFNVCHPGGGTACGNVDVPANFGGNTPARTGDGYVGFFTFYTGCSNCREYIQGPLTSPLVAGTTYEIGAYVRLAKFSRYATNRFGLHISTGTVNQPSNQPILLTPTIEHPTVIDDTANWVYVSDLYTAVGGENFFTFGNFYDNANTNIDTPAYPGGTCALATAAAFYYIDDVVVKVADSSLALASDTIVCVGDTSIIIASGCGPVSWANATNPSAIIFTGDTLITILSNTTSFIAYCATDTATWTVTVVNTPPPPTVLHDTNYCIAAGLPLFTGVGFPGATFNWYTSPPPSLIAASSPTYTPFVFGANTYNYWVTQVIGSCESAPFAFSINYRNSPTAPTVSNDTSYCAGDAISNLISTPPIPGNTINWYSDSSLNNIVSIGITFNPTVYVLTNGSTGVFKFYVTEKDSFCDGPVDSVTVTVNSILPAPTIANDTICENDIVIPYAPTQRTVGSIFSWHDSLPPNGFLNSSLTYAPRNSPIGIDSVWVFETDNNGCNSPATLVQTLINPIPNVNAGANDTICQGGTTSLNGAMFGAGTFKWSASPAAALSYLSDTTILNPLVNPPASLGGVSIIYTLTADNGECANFDDMILRIQSPPIASISGIDTTKTYCINHAPIQFNGLPNPQFNGGVGFFITQPYLTPAGLFSPQLVPNGPGFYEVQYFYEAVANCFDTITETIQILPIPSNLISIDTFGCIGDTLEVTYIGAANVEVFDWEFTNVDYQRGKDGGTYQLVWDDAGTYPINLTITGSNGCTNDTTVMIEIVGPKINTIDNTVINYGDEIYLYTVQIPQTEQFSYTWTPNATLNYDTAQNPLAEPTSHTTYIVTAIDSFGCTDSDTVRISVFVNKEFYMPNFFTPNNDGVNDFLFPFGKGIDEISWGVYDRWGQKLFNGDSMDDRWDGLFKGREINPGVMAYYAKVQYLDGKVQEFKGNITLVR